MMTSPSTRVKLLPRKRCAFSDDQLSRRARENDGHRYLQVPNKSCFIYGRPLTFDPNRCMYVLDPTAVAPIYLSSLSIMCWPCAMAGTHCAEYERRGMARSITCDLSAMQVYGTLRIPLVTQTAFHASVIPTDLPGTLHNLSDRSH